MAHARARSGYSRKHFSTSLSDSSRSRPAGPPVSLVKLEEETEARYLVSMPDALSFIKQKALRPVLMRQRYVVGHARKTVLKKLCKIAPQLETLLRGQIKTLRLRHVYSPHTRKSSFLAQLKGPRRNLISRQEISISLSRTQFMELVPFAQDGFVEKLRFVSLSSLQFRGRTLVTEVHIDIIRQLGLDTDRLHGRSLPTLLRTHAIVEIEMPHRAAYGALLRQGSTAVPMLGKALNLTALRKEGGLKFSLRMLAEGGRNKHALHRQMKKIAGHCRG